MIDVVVGIQVCVGDHCTGVGGVDELTVADVDANVGDTRFVCILEEHDVAGLQLVFINGSTLLIHGSEGTAGIEAERTGDVVDKAGTVKSVGRSAAPDVGNTQILLCGFDDFRAGCSRRSAGSTSGRGAAGVSGGTIQCSSAGGNAGGVAAPEEQGRLGGCFVFIRSLGQVQIVAADVNSLGSKGLTI